MEQAWCYTVSCARILMCCAIENYLDYGMALIQGSQFVLVSDRMVQGLEMDLTVIKDVVEKMQANYTMRENQGFKEIVICLVEWYGLAPPTALCRMSIL